MDSLKEAKERIRSVRGLGEARLRSLHDALGEEGFMEALSAGDVAALSSAERVSERLAVDLVLAYRGSVSESVLSTEGSREVHDDILRRLKARMHTGYAVNSVSLMVPGTDMAGNQQRASEAYSCRALLEGRDVKVLDNLLSTIGRPLPQRPRPSGLDYVLLAEDDSVLKRISELGLDRRCQVLLPEDIDRVEGRPVVLVYSSRELEEERLPLIHSVHMSARSHEIVPETVLDAFIPRSGQLKALASLEREFGVEGRAQEAVSGLEELSSLSKGPRSESEIRSILEGIRSEVGESMRAEISGMTLSGEDAIAILSRDEPEKLKGIYKRHERMASDLVWQRLGVKRDLFAVRYPLSFDEEALHRFLDDVRTEDAAGSFARRTSLAGKLLAMEEALEKELRWSRELDLKLGIGGFVSEHDLHPFTVTEGFFGVIDAASLDLRSCGLYQPVTYHLGKAPEALGGRFMGDDGGRMALLTGANSGGKTTLMETIAQTAVLSLMGLPVPAREAFVPRISKLLMFKPKRRLDAGGLEVFLKELLPLTLHVDSESLVLADELEAMTELEAASRIIGQFISELSEKKAFGIVVTHMADEIVRFSRCRVDGIEAKGLNDSFDLIVDRTPRIGYHARSTPELILRRLEAMSRGEERELYSRVLKRFD